MAINKIPTKQLLVEHGKILKLLKSCDHDICKYILSNSSSKLLECFRRIILNILHNKTKISNYSLKKLRNYKKELAIVAGATNSQRQKRVAL